MPPGKTIFALWYVDCQTGRIRKSTMGSTALHFLPEEWVWTTWTLHVWVTNDRNAWGSVTAPGRVWYKMPMFLVILNSLRDGTQNECQLGCVLCPGSCTTVLHTISFLPFHSLSIKEETPKAVQIKLLPVKEGRRNQESTWLLLTLWHGQAWGTLSKIHDW